MKLSLRATLNLWYVLTIPVLILGLSFTAQRIMMVTLREIVDDTLEEWTELVSRTIASGLRVNPEDYAAIIERVTEQELPQIPLLLRITDPKGTVLATFGDLPPTMEPVLDRQLRSAGGEERQFETVRVKGGDALRTYVAVVRDPATQQTMALIQAASGLALISGPEARLWRYALIEGIVGSVAVLGVGTLILHRGFRPLHRILRRVQAMETSDLQPGLPAEPRPPELQRLADSLNAMWSRLDLAFKARETFFASVSHDLRTPLTALQGQIDVLLLEDIVNPAAKESLERIAREVARLVRMTNNLLLNAELESHPSPVAAEVGLRDLVEEVVADTWVMAADLQIEVQAADEVTVAGDRDLLKELILNLVDNAIKFTPSPGHIKLTVTREAGMAVLGVEDSGAGISSEDLPHMGEPLYRAHGRPRHPRSGLGLGLVIARRVAALHGGKIDIQSQEGRGTTVTVSLPLQPASASGRSGVVRLA